MKAKFYTKLEDAFSAKERKSKGVEIEIEEGSNCLWIKPKGYGDHCSAEGHGIPICLEVYEGRLRVIVWPDINKEEPTIIDMEGARETARKPTKRIVKSKCLPFFKDDGTVSIWTENGQEEIVPLARFKDITTDGGRVHNHYKFEITE